MRRMGFPPMIYGAERHPTTKSLAQIMSEIEAERQAQPSAPRWPQLISKNGAIVSSAEGVVVVPAPSDPNWALSGGQGICFEREAKR